MNEKLAIIIPAFKYQFLSQSLNSIVNQSCKKFNLYIGNDCSPYDLESIIEPFKNQMPIRYQKFNENLGSLSLTRQWSRCIDLSENEEFIWLFSDDDIMPYDAVERFYRELEKNDYHDLYRFNLQFINEKNVIIRNQTNHPAVESSKDFLKRRLSFSTISSACEYIFRRTVYVNNNGFVEFPLAWCSDDATWAIFGRNNGILTIKGEPVNMRLSAGLNISSDTDSNKLKFFAVLSFVKWLNRNFSKEFDKRYYYYYIRGQITALSVSLIQRLPILLSFLFFFNPLILSALVLNRSKIYKVVDSIT